MTSVLAASFTARTLRDAACVTIHRIEDGRRRFIHTEPVADKREARKVAKAHGATPWNF